MAPTGLFSMPICCPCLPQLSSCSPHLSAEAAPLKQRFTRFTMHALLKHTEVRCLFLRRCVRLRCEAWGRWHMWRVRRGTMHGAGARVACMASCAPLHPQA